MPRYNNNAISNSQLSVLKRSAAEFYQRYILQSWKEEEPSDSLKLGSLLHCIALEPDKVSERFAIAPDVDGRTKEGKVVKAAFAEASNGKTIVSVGVAERAAICHAAIREHKDASRLLEQIARSDAVVEKPIYGEWNQVAVAGTPDLVVLDKGLIVDLKTTQDANPLAFAKSVASFGYHRQVAMYLELVEQAYGAADRFLFVVVRTTPPHEVAVYELNYSAVMQGRSELVGLIDEYRYRTASNDWVAPWGKGVTELALPRWYRDESFMYEEDAA